MNQEFVEALSQLERERGITKEILVEAVEAALVSALKRDQKSAQNIRVQLDPTTGDIRVFNRHTVVEEVLDEREEIDLTAAKKIDPHYEIGDVVEEEIAPKEFGRIAAQTAKQVIVQRIREAERSLVFDEFSNRVGDIVTGIVQRFDQRMVCIDLGKVEGVLPPSEQIPGERYEQGIRLKVYIVEVKRTTKGPQVITSRSRAGLLKRLFELEVPEIQEGLVEIKSVAREAGARSKIAVYSREPHVDPVGACVGARGNRVQMIVKELRGEKIDIIPWNPDKEMFVAKAMSPARVAAVQLAPSKRIALVVVPDHQLSLAIGREGQNARLAAKLTGWKIDIRSESQIAEMTEEELEAIIPLEDEFAEVPLENIGEESPAAAPVFAPEAESQPEMTSVEEVVVRVVDESDEEHAKEGPRRKARKDRVKQRELEREMETVDETGIAFFSDVLGNRQDERGQSHQAQNANGEAVGVTEASNDSDELSPLAEALRKASEVKNVATTTKRTAPRKTTSSKEKASTDLVTKKQASTKPAVKKKANTDPIEHKKVTRKRKDGGAGND